MLEIMREPGQHSEEAHMLNRRNLELTFWDQVSFVYIVVCNAMRHTERQNRSPSQNFPHNGIRIRQGIPIVVSWKTTPAHYHIYLLLGPFLRIGSNSRHDVEKCIQRCCRLEEDVSPDSNIKQRKAYSVSAA
jgi:hypothetical protein